MITESEIAANMRAERARKNLSQAEVAEALSIRREAYNEYELGKRSIRMNMLIKLAEVIGCNVLDFFVQSTPTNCGK